MTIPILASLKRILLPGGTSPQTVLFGPGAGAVMDIDFAHQARMYFGLYETEIAPHLRRLVRPGYRCFDVGANVGYHSLTLARLSGGPVVAFEPDPAAGAILRANIAHNNFAIRIVSAAVGARDDANTITLDRAAAENFIPDLIKIDIEGAETDALTGAMRLLRERKPDFIIETHGRALEDDCVAILRGNGYAVRAIAPRRFFAETRPAQHNGWLVAEARS